MPEFILNIKYNDQTITVRFPTAYFTEEFSLADDQGYSVDDVGDCIFDLTDLPALPKSKDDQGDKMLSLRIEFPSEDEERENKISLCFQQYSIDKYGDAVKISTDLLTPDIPYDVEMPYDENDFV